MSTKNNALVSAVCLALGVTVAADTLPICEGLLNDVTVTGFGAAEVDATGRCMVIVSVQSGVDTVVRPVADSLGNVRLYGDANAAISLAKRTNITAGTQTKYVKFNEVVTVGDPVVALKAKYKRFKTEREASVKQAAVVATKLTAAAALGWDAASGTPENVEYLDLVARAASINEWKAYNEAKISSLAASLTASGIDPATVI